jgi:hypothetical protein
VIRDSSAQSQSGSNIRLSLQVGEEGKSFACAGVQRCTCRSLLTVQTPPLSPLRTVTHIQAGTGVSLWRAGPGSVDGAWCFDM